MFKNLRYRFALFMQGRYGTDQLSRFISVVVLVLIAASWIAGHFPAFPGSLFFIKAAGIVYSVLLFVIYFRTFSRNIPARYAENQKYLALRSRFLSFFSGSGRSSSQHIEYHIYKCPQCSQKIRIPRGKGKIMVRCPKCGTEFVKQS